MKSNRFISLLRQLKWDVSIVAILIAATFFNPVSLYIIYQYVDPFLPVFHGLRLPTSGLLAPGFLAYAFLFFTLTSLFGRSILWSYWRDYNGPFLFMLWASFWAGYLGSIGAFRVLSLYLKPIIATGLIVTLMISVVMYHLHRGNLRVFPAKKYILPKLKTAFYVLGGVLFLLLIYALQVFQHDFSFVGHGTPQYIHFVNSFLRDQNSGTLPIIAHHCDEVLYTLFALAPIKFEFDAILLTGVTLALNKLSLALFTFSVLKRFGAPVWFGCAITFYFMFGTFGLDPSKYVIYFDSGNPGSYIAHSGRLVQIPFFFLIASSILSMAKGGKRFFSGSTVAILGFGIATTSIANFVFGFCLFAFGALTIFLRKKTSSKFLLSTSGYYTVLLSLGLIFVGPMISYTHPFLRPNPSLPAGSPFVFTLIGISLLVLNLMKSGDFLLKASSFKDFIKNQDFKLLIVYSGAGILCLLFFANFFADNSLNRFVLHSLKTITGNENLYIFNPFYAPAGPSPEFALGAFVDSRELTDAVQYSRSALHFIFTYGSLLLLGVSSYSTVRGKILAPMERQTLLMLTIAYAMVFSLFFYIDFVNDLPRSWIKTRFLEGPFYTFLLFYFVLLVQQQNKVKLGFISLLAVGWSLTPILATQRPAQWLRNWEFLRDIL